MNTLQKTIYFIVILLTIEHIIITSLLSQKIIDCSNKKHEYLLYIMVMTAPSSTENRQNIRETWLNEVRNRSSYIKFHFFIGTKNLTSENRDILFKEQTEYEDIILLSDVEEKYELTTYKLLEMLKWTHQNINAVYYFKTDDDCYFSVDRFVSILTTEGLPTEKLLLGHFLNESPVLKEGKWADFDWSLCSIYLPYPNGVGFLLTRDLVAFIAINNDKLEFHSNDDTALGVWFAGLNVTYLTSGRIYYNEETCQEDGYIFHHFDVIGIKRMHQLWLTHGKTCSE